MAEIRIASTTNRKTKPKTKQKAQARKKPPFSCMFCIFFFHPEGFASLVSIMLGILSKASQGNSVGELAKGSNTGVCFSTRWKVIP